MISCSDYDYIEIVCLYTYPIKLTLKTGDVITGKALDTTRNNTGEECIKININGAESLVVLENIQTLTVTIENPHFKEVSFS